MIDYDHTNDHTQMKEKFSFLWFGPARIFSLRFILRVRLSIQFVHISSFILHISLVFSR